MNPILQKIQSHGYWHVIVRPTEFSEDRITSPQQCKTIVQECNVKYRGLSYPWFNFMKNPDYGANYVEQYNEQGEVIEGWRFYQSAQFAQCRALWEDWLDPNIKYSDTRLVKPGECLSVVGTVYFLTELYEFAARIAEKGVLGKDCEILVALRNSNGRKLASLNPLGCFSGEYRLTKETISPQRLILSSADLMANSSELALAHVVWIFERFGLDNLKPDIYRDEQRKLLEKRL